MFCSKCGSEINEDAAFCPNCGMPKNGVGTNNKKSFDINSLKDKVKNKPFLIIGGVVILFILFKVFTSFSDIGSFAKEMNEVKKQIQEGNYNSIIDNNIDYTGMINEYTTEAQLKNSLKQALNQQMVGGTSVNVVTSLLKGSDLEKKLNNVSKEAMKAMEIKYDAKVINKGVIRVTLKHNLPRPTVLNNSKIGEKVQKIVEKVYPLIISSSFNYNNRYMSLVNSLSEFDKPIIELLKTYKSLGKDLKENFEIYVDFHKKDGHWKYKLQDVEGDIDRITSTYGDYQEEWYNASGILESFISRYGLN